MAGRPARVGGARIETLPILLREHPVEVAPPAWAGRGLKPMSTLALSAPVPRRPARVGGARIETK